MRFQCRNCGRVEPKGIYCKGCGYRRPKPDGGPPPKGDDGEKPRRPSLPSRPEGAPGNPRRNRASSRSSGDDRRASSPLLSSLSSREVRLDSELPPLAAAADPGHAPGSAPSTSNPTQGAPGHVPLRSKRARAAAKRADSLTREDAEKEERLKRRVFDDLDARIARGNRQSTSRDKPGRRATTLGLGPNPGAPPIPPKRRKSSKPTAFNPNCLPML